MDELPDSLKDEIAALESLDARALRRRYAPLVADLPNCALCGVLRATVTYRLQERHYGLSLSPEATAWLDEAVDDKRAFSDGRKVGSGARLVRIWKGERCEATVRDDGRYEYNGEIYSSLSAIAKAITGTHWNGKLEVDAERKDEMVRGLHAQIDGRGTGLGVQLTRRPVRRLLRIREKPDGDGLAARREEV